MVGTRQADRVLKRSFKKILVPLNGSKNSFRALKESINLAKFTESQVIGIYVIPEDISSLPIIEIVQPLSTLHQSGFEKKIFRHGKKIIADAEEICKRNKIKFLGHIVKGNPGYDIVKFSSTNKVGLIVIGSRGKGPAKEIFLGSVSNYVVHKAKCPVMIIK
ncbi:MAG: universal stress protein [Nitrosarchaeum sp.]|nr:universal stress protein [Nitrosarchaeum sp.]